MIATLKVRSRLNSPMKNLLNFVKNCNLKTKLNILSIVHGRNKKVIKILIVTLHDQNFQSARPLGRVDS